MNKNKKKIKSLLYATAFLAVFSPLAVGDDTNEVKADSAVASAVTNVGITFLDGSLTLVSVPNFDFGANTIDGRTRFLPLYSNAKNSVGDASNGAFVDTSSGGTSGSIVETLRDPSNYRALIVSDSRLPINSSGAYNGWKVSAHMTVGSASSLVGSNMNSASDDPNPDGLKYGSSRRKFVAAIMFGNGFDSAGYTVNSLTDGQEGNRTKISHPATYYNADPYLTGTGRSGVSQSVWERADTSSTDVPSDNQTTGTFAGIFFPRLSRPAQSNTGSQLTNLTGTHHPTDTANNPTATTIPMSDVDNEIWGYTISQSNEAGVVRPNSVSNGAWALDFSDKGSAILGLPSSVTMDRPGTYIYNLYWTLSSGFQANP